MFPATSVTRDSLPTMEDCQQTGASPPETASTQGSHDHHERINNLSIALSGILDVHPLPQIIMGWLPAAKGSAPTTPQSHHSGNRSTSPISHHFHHQRPYYATQQRKRPLQDGVDIVWKYPATSLHPRSHKPTRRQPSPICKRDHKVSRDQ